MAQKEISQLAADIYFKLNKEADSLSYDSGILTYNDADAEFVQRAENLEKNMAQSQEGKQAFVIPKTTAPKTRQYSKIISDGPLIKPFTAQEWEVFRALEGSGAMPPFDDLPSFTQKRNEYTQSAADDKLKILDAAENEDKKGLRWFEFDNTARQTYSEAMIISDSINRFLTDILYKQNESGSAFLEPDAVKKSALNRYVNAITVVDNENNTKRTAVFDIDSLGHIDSLGKPRIIAITNFKKVNGEYKIVDSYIDDERAYALGEKAGVDINRMIQYADKMTEAEALAHVAPEALTSPTSPIANEPVYRKFGDQNFYNEELFNRKKSNFPADFLTSERQEFLRSDTTAQYADTNMAVNIFALLKGIELAGNEGEFKDQEGKIIGLYKLADKKAKGLTPGVYLNSGDAYNRALIAKSAQAEKTANRLKDEVPVTFSETKDHEVFDNFLKSEPNFGTAVSAKDKLGNTKTIILKNLTDVPLIPLYLSVIDHDGQRKHFFSPDIPELRDLIARGKAVVEAAKETA